MEHSLISRSAPEIFILLSICLTADSTAPEPTLAYLFCLKILVVDNPATMLVEVSAKIPGKFSSAISK